MTKPLPGRTPTFRGANLTFCPAHHASGSQCILAWKHKGTHVAYVRLHPDQPLQLVSWPKYPRKG